MELDSRKKSRRNKMMRSKSFDSQVREIDRKEAGKLKGFPIYQMGITKMSYRWKERHAKSRRN